MEKAATISWSRVASSKVGPLQIKVQSFIIKNELQDGLMELHKRVKTIAENWIERESRYIVSMCKQYEEKHWEILIKLLEFLHV